MMRDSVSSWTANTSEDQEEGVSEKPLIGPQRPGALSQSGSGVGPTIGPSFKVRGLNVEALQFFLIYYCTCIFDCSACMTLYATCMLRI